MSNENNRNVSIRRDCKTYSALFYGGSNAMALVLQVTRDMFEGVKKAGNSCSWDAFLQSACLYQSVKYGLSNQTMDEHPVDDHTFFLLKKCIFHWCEGIKLAYILGGLGAEKAGKLAAEDCSAFLHGKNLPEGGISQKVQKEYQSGVSGEILQQYARQPEVPSDKWCAWLELTAAKLTALGIEEQQKD